MEEKIFPAMDSVLAGIAGAFAFAAVATLSGTPSPGATSQQTDASTRKREIMFLAAVSLAGPTTASAIWGFVTTKRCREYLGD
jgi:hypothetical protein